MKLVPILIGVVLISACTADSPGAPTGPVDTELVLAPGQTADVANTNIQLRFDGVSGDSRCPADVVCIQAGDAIVRIEVLPKSGAARAYDLHTGNRQPVRHDDLTIALENLSPYPFSSRTIAPGDYRATLRVTR
jgi:hypothetical protein